MPLTAKAVFANTDVRHALQQAWIDSNPGVTGRHWEGGFVVRDAERQALAKRITRYNSNSTTPKLCL
jgi:hypothetical protein